MSEIEICPHTKKPLNCSNCKGAVRKETTGKTRMHMSQSITGPLRNWNKKDWKIGAQYISRADGTKMDADELKDEFLKTLSEGKEVVPIGDCDNFCYKTGCMGHNAD